VVTVFPDDVIIFGKRIVDYCYKCRLRANNRLSDWLSAFLR